MCLTLGRAHWASSQRVFRHRRLDRIKGDLIALMKSGGLPIIREAM
jgi:hypothetical protein